jgi:DNA-binding transcriptional LysR family regulator
VTTNVSATLMVGAVESLSAYVLPSRLAALRERWPKVRVEVMTGLCSEIRESVAAGKSDLGLVLEAETGMENGSILSKARLLIFGSPSHPLVHRRPSPDELRRCDFFMSDAAGNYHQVLRQYFEGAQVPLPRTQALGSIEGLKRWILAEKTALGVLPAHALEQELRDGVLAEVSVSPALPGLVLRAVSSTEGTSSPIIDDLIQSLRGLSLRG